MSYQVFARKYRPQTFDDIVGQEHVVRTLKNAIEQNRLAHAYLFVGPRGVGKTSTARILAKALNCADGPKVNFDPESEICREIAEGRSLDVLEIDGASNNGVEQVRELRENAKFAPARCPFKLYIIDEVHMLSTSAFNALLKTLEEPPPHVKFVFATTEAHKVLPTILSRCQRFDLSRISTPLISEHLLKIAGLERIDLSERAAFSIAKAAEGGLRDAESMLDQLVAFCGGTIREEDVLRIFGLAGVETVASLAGEIIGLATADALRGLQKYADQGKDLMKFLGDLIGYLRNLLILRTSPESFEEEIAPDLVEIMRAQAEQIETERLLQLIDLFAETEGRMKWAPNKRLHFEVAVIKAIHTLGETSLSDVIAAVAGIDPDSAGGSGAGAGAEASAVARPQPKVIKPKGDSAEKSEIKTEAPAPKPLPKPETAPEPAPATQARKPDTEPKKVPDTPPEKTVTPPLETPDTPARQEQPAAEPQQVPPEITDAPDEAPPKATEPLQFGDVATRKSTEISEEEEAARQQEEEDRAKGIIPDDPNQGMLFDFGDDADADDAGSDSGGSAPPPPDPPKSGGEPTGASLPASKEPAPEDKPSNAADGPDKESPAAEDARDDLEERIEAGIEAAEDHLNNTTPAGTEADPQPQPVQEAPREPRREPEPEEAPPWEENAGGSWVADEIQEAASAAPQDSPGAEPEAEATPARETEAPAKESAETLNLDKVWTQLLQHIQEQEEIVPGYLKTGHPLRLENNRLVIGFREDDDFQEERFRRKISDLQETLHELTGQTIRLETELRDDLPEQDPFGSLPGAPQPNHAAPEAGGGSAPGEQGAAQSSGDPEIDYYVNHEQQSAEQILEKFMDDPLIQKALQLFEAKPVDRLPDQA